MEYLGKFCGTVRGIKKKFPYIFLLLLPIFLMALRGPIQDKAKAGLITLLKPLLKSAHFLTTRINNAIAFKGFSAQKFSWRRETQTLKAQVAQLQETSLENQRLRELLLFKKSSPFQTVPALVIAKDSSNWRHTILIDKGTRHDIAKGMPVVSPQGLVGRIINAGQFTSRVILITDPDSRVAALLQTSREEGVVYGGLKEICKMKFIPKEAEVKMGELVVCSGFGGFYPKGLLIGEVIGVSQAEDDLSAYCLVRPSAPLRKLEEVLVIVK